VRPEGLGYRDAAAKLVYLLEQALSRELTGVGLKDESGAAGEALTTQPNFLLGES
jgi:ethanolamine ammonia-lyase small subunit